MPRVKEIHHFDDETNVDWERPDHSRLHSFYDWSLTALRGEATPIYCYWPHAMERIKKYNPEAKLIMAIRHPFHRALSQWRMETARGREHLPFAEAISATGRDRLSGTGGFHRVYSYVERGFYGPQIERLYRLFPRNNVYVYRTDDLWREPSATLTSIEIFLGLPPILARSVKPCYITPVPSAGYRVDPSVLRYLNEKFAPDIRRTANLTGLDLADWLEGYAEPMRE
jgi:hypothetical protein